MRRRTHHISRKQASNSRPAILLAAKLGTPLDHLVTVNFTKQGLHDERAAHAALDKIRSRYCRRARKPGKRQCGSSFDGAMIWVLEQTTHLAAHLLLHVPPSRLAGFTSKLNCWLEKDCHGARIVPGAIDIRPVYNAFGLRKYFLKGLNPAYCPLYRITHVPQGVITGKRFGYTQNLGPSACKKHGTKQPYRWPKRSPPTTHPTASIA